ncbi:MAG: winged helix-turn-helix domain-containing protein [Candidatus Kariarchaeaceae archaeon]|jgi:hypothetical protein
MGEEVDYDALIHGTTLKVYKFLLSSPKSVGVRELQRSLNFSSPSVAAHHLNKLEEWGICSKSDDNRYRLEKRVNIGVMKHFILLRGSYLPRFAFHTAFFVTVLITYLIYSFFTPSGRFDRIIGFSVLIVITSTVAYETWRLLNMLKIGA